MLQLSFVRMLMDLLSKHSILISAFVVLLLPNAQPAEGLSVPNLCMLEQRRLFNISNHVKKRQEDQIIDTIDTICGDYIHYITCFTNNLPNSHEIGDRFSRLMYQPQSMFAAYNGLCVKDLESLRQIKACLVVTPDLRECYKKYEKGVEKVIELQDQGTFTTGDLERLACNVSVGRYKCEIDAYGDCNNKAREIMQDFIYASLSDKCRERMGLTSRYITNFRKTTHTNGGRSSSDTRGKATFQRGPKNSASSANNYGLLLKTIVNFVMKTVALSVNMHNNN